METEIQKIVSLLKLTFEKEAWHGPSVLESLENITQEQASKKLPNTHSIIELVSHMTAWRIYVCKKLEGDFEYKVTEELNFPQTQNWSVSLQQLHESQKHLMSALEKFSVEKLSELVPNTNHRYYTLLHGIIHHDLYHTGQIILIKKATAKQTF